MRQLAQELIQLLLTICQFATTAKIDAETGHDAIDDQESVFVGGEVGGKGVEEFELVLEVVNGEIGRSGGERGHGRSTSLLRALA